MGVVGINIGTEFGAKNCKSDSSELAFEAYSHAINIENHITSREADSKIKAILSENNFLQHMDNGSALRECTRVIVCLMQISANMDFTQRSPIICIDLDQYGSLKDASVVLIEATTRLRQIFYPDGNITSIAALYHEILNSIRLACVIAAKFGETDLEPYISQVCWLDEHYPSN